MEGVTGDAERQGPWERLAWVMGVVWVVFMAFPISSALGADVPGTARGTAVGLLLAYAATYIAGYIWMIRSDDWNLAARRGITAIVVMVALMSAAALLIGPGALGAGSFLLSLAMFAGPVRPALAFASALLIAEYAVIAVVLSAVPNGFDEFGILFMPPAIVYVSVGVVRMIVAAQERHDVVERQMALVAERERVARDVHDVLGHSLTVVTVKAELAERLIDLDPARARSEIAEIRSLAREALAEVRATVSGLRVARLGDELDAARTALAGAGIAAELPADPSVVDPRHRIVVAWVLREAITNVVRHSHAASCIVTLAHDGIVVSDDGIGVSADAVGLGFRGLRERVAAAGGTLHISDAHPGTRRPGTRLEVRW
ncbi:MAG TPA: sensor histidine kinase [Microbacterium sp.]|nr:sensor histidine kinase [Microbacterium sp.]